MEQLPRLHNRPVLAIAPERELRRARLLASIPAAPYIGRIGRFPMSIIEQLQNSLGETYQVDRELGGGGMSRVFLARETALGRQVVIKVVAPHLAAGVSLDRFRREILLAARLQHPHIVPVLSAGEADGLPFFTMPYIEGQTLRERLRDAGPLPLSEAVRVLREIALALSYAHDAAIVHRDIKPENVLLSKGLAMVTDFGVAKALTDASPTLDGEFSTTVGVARGTPAYMAPEQIAADPGLTIQADVYSFGALAYELLTGRPVFGALSAQAVMAAHIASTPEPVERLRPEAPPGLSRLVMQCLSKEPNERPTSGQVVERLDELTLTSSTPKAQRRLFLFVRRRASWVASAVAATLLLAATIAATNVPAERRATLLTLWRRQPRIMQPNRVVVAPLENRTGDTSLTVLGEMAGDFIAQRLAQTGEFEIVDPRTASFTARIVAQLPRIFRNGDPAIALAEETGAGTVLAGSFYVLGDSLQFQMRVVDAATGKLRRVVAPVAGVRDQPRELVSALSVRATGALVAAIDTVTSWWGEPPSLDAYRETMDGYERWMRYDTAAAFAKLRHASMLDSNYSAPLMFYASALADYHQWTRMDAVIQTMRQRWDRLTPPERGSVGVFEAWRAGDYAEALRRDRRITGAPGFGELSILGVVYFAVSGNRPYDALRGLAKLDPHRGILLINPIYWKWRGMALWQLGRYRDELRNAADAIAQFPENPKARWIEIQALAALDQTRALEDRLDGSLGRAPPPGYTVETWSGYARLHSARILRLSGDSSGSAQMLNRLVAVTRRMSDSSLNARMLHAFALYESGRLVEAAVVVGRLRAADSSLVDATGLAGLIAARSGKPNDAARIGRALRERADSSSLLGRHLYWSARIAALVDAPDTAIAILRHAIERGHVATIEMADYALEEGFDARADLEFKPLSDNSSFKALFQPRDRD